MTDLKKHQDTIPILVSLFRKHGFFLKESSQQKSFRDPDRPFLKTRKIYRKFCHVRGLVFETFEEMLILEDFKDSR